MARSERSESGGMPQISETLQQFIKPEDILKNRRHYPELQKPLSSEDQRLLTIVKERLLRLPLVHCSREKNLKSVSPHCAIEQRKPAGNGSNTYQLDSDLGLDGAVFLSWGMGDWSQYGQNFYFIDAGKILTDSRCVATPQDIHAVAPHPLSEPISIYTPTERKELEQGYFQKMVTGHDWLEIVARKVLKRLRGGEKIVGIDYKTFGEIKFFGSITESSIVGQVSGRQDYERRYYPLMYQLGFGFTNIEDAVRQRESGQKVYTTDPTPAELGIDYEHLRQTSWPK